MGFGSHVVLDAVRGHYAGLKLLLKIVVVVVVFDILLLLMKVALVVVCHMNLTVLEWLSSLITYILLY